MTRFWQRYKSVQLLAPFFFGFILIAIALFGGSSSRLVAATDTTLLEAVTLASSEETLTSKALVQTRVAITDASPSTPLTVAPNSGEPTDARVRTQLYTPSSSQLPAPLARPGSILRSAATVPDDPTLDYPSTHRQVQPGLDHPGLPNLASTPPRASTILATPPMPDSSSFVVDVVSSRVWGVVTPGTTITVTVDGVQMGAAQADNVGFFWTPLYAATGSRHALSAGEVIAIHENGTQLQATTLRAISGEVDVIADTISGNVSGWTSQQVTIYPGFGDPDLASLNWETPTDVSGDFSLDLSGDWNLIADELAVVSYIENDIAVHTCFYAQRLVVQPWPLSMVLGRAAPGEVVTLTVLMSDAVSIRETMTSSTEPGTGRYTFYPAMQDDDIVIFDLEDGTTLSRTVDTLWVEASPDSDLITGIAQSGNVVVAKIAIPTSFGWQRVTSETVADGSGLFTFTLASIGGIAPGRWYGVYVADDEGDDLNLWTPAQGSVTVDQSTESVWGIAEAPPGGMAVGGVVTLTYYSASADATSVYTSERQWYGNYQFDPEAPFPPDIDFAPGDIVTVTSEGTAWEGVVEIKTMTANADTVLDRITGDVELPSDQVEVGGQKWNGWSSAQVYPVAGSFALSVTANSPYTAIPSGFDMRNEMDYYVSHFTAAETQERVSGKLDFVRAWPGFNGVILLLSPENTVYTLTLRNAEGGLKAEITDIWSQPPGSTTFVPFDSVGAQMMPGDELQVQTASGFDQALVIPELSVSTAEAPDRITGSALANQLVHLYLDDEDQGWVPTGPDGSFSVRVEDLQTRLGDGQYTWREGVRLCVETLEGNTACEWFNLWPEIIAHYSQDGYNDVWGSYAIPGNPIQITVTDELHHVVASGIAWPGSGDQGPNSYRLEFPTGTIVPGSTVTADFGDGVVESVEVVALTGYPGVAADIVTGTAPADSYVSVNVDCYYGGCWHDLPSVPVDASGIYTADFGAAGRDLWYGDWFNVHYGNERGHQTQFSFWIPVPELQVDKQQTPGMAGPGGTYLYQIRYWNNGNGDAENAVITDTLPPDASYFADTGGFSVFDAGGVITWALDIVPANSYGEFYVALSIAPTVTLQTNLGDNCVSIDTASPGDPDWGNNGSCTGGPWVDSSDVGIGVNKWPDPYDPTPGQEFHYYIDYWSDTDAATGPVWLTDTLPMSTTFVRWEEQRNWDALWTEVITTGGQFALYAPAGIPGSMGGRIRLTLALDPAVPLGTRLTNHVAVTTSADIDPDNNEHTNTEVEVSGPRYDLQLYKNGGSGDLTPGGVTDYRLQVENRGNTAVHAWLTDTLPSGTTYREGSGGYWDWNGWNSVDPAEVTDAYVVWDLGMIGVGQNTGFGFQVAISESIQTGAGIENCATVASPYVDNTPANNTACAATMIYPDGANLRVYKWHQWNGDGQLGYQVQIQNIGDEVVPDVVLTDTYPVSTSLNGSPWWDGGLPFNPGFTDDAANRQLIWSFDYLEPGWVWNAWFNVDLDPALHGERMHWYTNTLETLIPDSDPSPGDNIVENVAFSGGEVDQAEVWTRPGHNGSMWGSAVPGWVTVTTAYTTVVTWADGGCDGCWQVDNAGPLGAGDAVTVAAGSGLMPIQFSLPDPFTVEVDATTDVVYGQVGDWNNQPLEVHGYWPAGYQEVTTGGDGSFTAPFADVPRGSGGYIRYQTQANYAEVIVHREFVSSDLLVTVDYHDNGVDGNYEQGHTGWVTVTNADGTETKGTVEIVTDAWPWWGGNSGFSTHHHNDAWNPSQPDIVPGDWVYVTLDNGESTEVQVGTLDVVVDTASNVMSGTLDVAWYSDPLHVSCQIHEENAPNSIDAYVDPDGGTFRCDYTGLWDIVPGNSLAVSYTEPDGDRVQNRPENPAPYVRVQKWLEGGGLTENGNAIFTLQYRNEGGLAAEHVVITDVLQGMAYLTDTSGVAPMGSGSGPIAWMLGTVDPGDWIQFQVFVEVLDSEGAWVTNTVEITTSNPYNQGPWEDRHAMWTDQVWPNGTQLNIGKSAWTGDPAAGRDIVFDIGVCNNGGTASAAVVLTDTLHPSMTLQTWWANAPGWQEVSSSTQQLVLTRPSISGWWCGQVYVVATVDAGAWSGMPISNTATLSSANDLDTGDNVADWWGNVGEEHTNLSIYKSFGSGQLVPGGEIRYWINLYNNGNVPVGAFNVTDTLPVSTTFIAAWHHDSTGSSPVPPTYSTTEVLVWEYTGLDNGYGDSIEVVLTIDADAAPGTVLTNTAEISHLPGEDGYDENTSAWVETVYEPGPNLRVRKEGQWDDWQENTRRASYWLTVENIGNTPVWDVVITDTYPTGMRMDGGLGVNYWQWSDWRENGDHFTVTLEVLEPGWSVGMNFGLITDTEPLPFGLIFTNTAEVMPVSGDVNPDDNRDELVLTTGPDLYVDKTLVAGDLLPGELVTYSLVFGNDRQGYEWWWGTQGQVWITDTLPSGFTFITATQISGDWTPRMPDATSGDSVGWNVGPLGPGWWSEIRLTVRIPDDATGLDTFTNWVEVSSGEPLTDTEPYDENNSDSVTFDIAQPYFEVTKAYESGRVAGMPVTYTLIVTNTGAVAGTNVVLRDTVPTGLTDVGGDGSYAAGDVTWTFASIAPGVSESGWFSALLPCTLGAVANADYRVVSSDQGVASSDGAPVAFTVIAPSLTVSGDASDPVVVASTVYFTATADTDGTPFTYAWDFGAGPVSGSATASHVFNVDGTHPVTVTVTDACGFEAQDVIQVTVNPPDLVADFVTLPTTPNIIKGQSVHFTDTTTTDGPAVVSWAWDFGDGAGGALQNPVHTYHTVGTFDITLTVTDALGYSDTVMKLDHVNVALDCMPLSSVAIAFAPSQPVIHETVTLTATTLPTGATAPITFSWTFGDGNGSTVTVPSIQHTYAVSGALTVALTAYNPCTLAGVSQQTQITIMPYTVYLPLILRSHP